MGFYWCFCLDTRVTCSGNRFRCQFSSECIPASGVCNGVEECEDGTDESHCNFSESFHDCSRHCQSHFLTSFLIVVIIVFTLFWSTAKRFDCKRPLCGYLKKCKEEVTILCFLCQCGWTAKLFWLIKLNISIYSVVYNEINGRFWNEFR